MPSGRVLLVGHCHIDTPRIQKVLSEVGAQAFDSVQSVAEALEKCQEEDYDLVVGNRVLGFDQEGGLRLTQQLKNDDKTCNIPVLVLSAFSETQDAVVAAGGERGFGKDDMDSPEARQQWASYFA